jgi:hypothetical protein
VPQTVRPLRELWFDCERSGHRDALNQADTDPEWARWAINSAYLVEVVLLLYYDTDTTYTPE